MGEVIQGTTILPIKVPLRESLTSSLPSEERFPPSALLALIQEKDLKLGGVVDLTYTTKYYDSQFFPTNGVGYKKVFTEGHVIPNDKTFEQFTEAIKSLEKEDEVICVHCTHGLNRSGYMICRYMIEVLSIEPQTAIQLFEKARGHKMERQNYLNDLSRRTPGVLTVDSYANGTHDMKWNDTFHPSHNRRCIRDNASTSSHQDFVVDESRWNNDYHSCHRRNRALAWKERSNGYNKDQTHWRRDFGSGAMADDQPIQNRPNTHTVFDERSLPPNPGYRGDDRQWNDTFHSGHSRNNTHWRRGGRGNSEYDGRWNHPRQDYNSIDSRYNPSGSNNSGWNQGRYGSGWGRGRGNSNNMKDEGRGDNWNRGRSSGEAGVSGVGRKHKVFGSNKKSQD